MTTEPQIKTSNAKISEALELLNDAAKDKKEELKDLMANRYSDIRAAIVEGGEKVKEIADCVDKRVHKDPWIYIAGTAAVTLLLGYFMGSKRK
ncbi:MAG: hypothetical protein HQL24_08975 [Candidatus Omnitrophica bacterium]|nr:hypothetical protein [Candidatus Omnitrophota bacterium]